MAASLADNIAATRRALGLTQEELAAKVGVSRQTVSDWECGSAVPDLGNAGKISRALGVTLDDLVGFDSPGTDVPVPPKGKHLFDTVTVGARGQIVIPKAARDRFGIRPGDSLVVLGDDEQGIAITKTETFLEGVERLRSRIGRTDGRD